MSRAVLISIRPKWCEKIIRGEKKIEVRRNFPKLDVPFKVYIYCTRQNLLMKSNVSGNLCVKRGKSCKETLESHSETEYSGKIIGEFVCRTMEEFTTDYRANDAQNVAIAKDACMTLAEMTDYEYKGHSACLFGWHISDLKIYDTPKELNEFWFPPELYCEKERCGSCPYDQVADVNGEYSYDCEWKRPLKRAPQSWQYVEELK